MYQSRVAALLKDSWFKTLLNMLKRMEMEPITPNIMLKRLMLHYQEVLTHHIIRKSLTYLEEHIPNLDSRFLLLYTEM